MRTRSLLAWVAVGLIGLALAAGVTYAATQLSSQRIGLSAEPPSAGEELAPRGAHPVPRIVTTPTQTRTAGQGTGSTPTQPAEERGWREHQAHRGEGFDDRDD